MGYLWRFAKPALTMNLAIQSITVLAAGYICYHFLIRSESLKSSFETRWGMERTKIYWIYFWRYLGVFLYGVVPVVLIIGQGLDFQRFGLSFKNGMPTLWWTAGLSLVVLVMNYFATRSPDNLAQYPQIRAGKWSRSLVAGSALTWTAYLLAYEFLFRGFLLFSCVEEMGIWTAITVNTALYALVHVPKGIKEAIGAIPLGVLLCWLSLQTGTIWIAFLVHVVMALSNEWFSIYYTGRRAVG
jgi:membrane protease YdiL (CAAX protease family)